MTTPYYPTRWLISAADTSDDPDVFPFLTGQSFLQLKTPVWSTATVTSVSGVERRRALWSYPIWKFKVAYEVLRDGPSYLELQRLWLFFNTHQGSFKEFFYYDRFDHSVLGQPIGTGDGVTTAFQLKRSISIGANTFTEPVMGVSGTPTIYVNGTPTSAYTIGPLGILTFTSAPAAAASITWDGSFFFLCRFVKDELTTQQMMNGLWSEQGLELISVKN
jgi:uncharacterized protein (TIGR02217 family)